MENEPKGPYRVGVKCGGVKINWAHEETMANAAYAAGFEASHKRWKEFCLSMPDVLDRIVSTLNVEAATIQDDAFEMEKRRLQIAAGAGQRLADLIRKALADDEKEASGDTKRAG